MATRRCKCSASEAAVSSLSPPPPPPPGGWGRGVFRGVGAGGGVPGVRPEQAWAGRGRMPCAGGFEASGGQVGRVGRRGQALAEWRPARKGPDRCPDGSQFALGLPARTASGARSDLRATGKLRGADADAAVACDTCGDRSTSRRLRRRAHEDVLHWSGPWPVWSTYTARGQPASRASGRDETLVRWCSGTQRRRRGVQPRPGRLRRPGCAGCLASAAEGGRAG